VCVIGASSGRMLARLVMIPPLLDVVRARVRDVPDFPKPGIVFKDLTPVFSDPLLFHGVVSALAARVASLEITEVVGIEARGFIIGGALAATLRRGFVPVRKPGKLPRKSLRETYGLEYGNDVLEVHADALVKNARVLIVDDLLATGGTAAATERLVKRAGGTVVAFAFLIELAFLKGAERIGSDRVVSLLRYETP
jgi:adenine phosphoribosyltransferase